MAIPISEFFTVTTKIEVGGVTALDFGRGLVLTTDDSISAGGAGKVSYYTDAEQVNDVFGSDSEPGKAAAKWFGYDPYPQGLYIGRWAASTVSTSLRGSAPSALSSLALANATFSLYGEDVTVDLSAQTTFAGIASTIASTLTTTGYSGALAEMTYAVAGGDQGGSYGAATTLQVSAPSGGGQTATATPTIAAGKITHVVITDGGSGYTSDDVLTVAVDTADSGSGADLSNITLLLERTAIVPQLVGATFQYVDNVFLLTLSGSAEIDPAYFGATGDGTDISASLGLAQSSNPTYLEGSDAESPADAVGTIAGLVSDRPIYLALDEGCPATYGADDNLSVESLWTLAESSDYMFGFSDTTDAARQAGETTSDLYRAESAQRGNTIACVADSDKQSHIGALAALSSINWDQPQSIITLFGKTFPGIEATNITPTELGVIEGKRGNVYTRVGGLPTFIEGRTSRAGYWADAVAMSIWLKNEVELGIWNAVRASRRLTVAILRATLDDSMRKAVRNGGLQPGRTVSNTTKADIIATTGNLDFDGVLGAGYLIHIGRLSEQTAVDIENRMAPPIRIWSAGSEALHRAQVDIILSS